MATDNKPCHLAISLHATAGSMAYLGYFLNIVIESLDPHQWFPLLTTVVYIQSKCQPHRHPRYSQVITSSKPGDSTTGWNIKWILLLTTSSWTPKRCAVPCVYKTPPRVLTACVSTSVMEPKSIRVGLTNSVRSSKLSLHRRSDPHN